MGYIRVSRSFPPFKLLILKLSHQHTHKHTTTVPQKHQHLPKQPQTFTCRGNKVLLLLSVRNMFSSIQDLGPTDPPERGNLGGAMTLLEKGFFIGEAWLPEPGMPMPLPLRWSRPQDIPPEPQPFPWWPPQGDGFTMGCMQKKMEWLKIDVYSFFFFLKLAFHPVLSFYPACRPRRPRHSLICSCNGWVDKKI